jgi:hypothetical protein
VIFILGATYNNEDSIATSGAITGVEEAQAQTGTQHQTP